MTAIKKDVRIQKKTQQVPPVKLPLSLQIKRDLILKSITFDYTRIVFVWSCNIYFPIEFTLQTLSRYGTITSVKYQWSVSDRDGSNERRSALVEFAKRSDAEKATQEFPYRDIQIRIAMLSSLILHISNFEVMYPSSEENATKITIFKRGFLQIDDVKKLHQKLHTYGSITFLTFDNLPNITASYCVVSYLSVTQAYLAMIMTNGTIVSENILSCDLHRDEKEEKILQTAKDYETLCLGRNFPY